MTHIQLNSPAVHASAWGAKGQDWFSLPSLGSLTGASGAMFSNVLSSIVPATPTPAAQSSTLSQLQALVQSGTPPSTIAQTIASQVISDFQRQFGTLTNAQQTQIRTSIQQLVERELGGTVANNAPPLKGPPLQSLGQQNEISGSILDANSAKDIPAQAPAKGTSSALDVSSLVQSSLAQALATLNASSHANAPTRTAASSSTLQSVPVLGPPSMTLSPDQSAQPAVPQHAPADPSSSLQTSSNDAEAAIAMDNAPDLLARMLVRASATDVKINGNAMFSTPQAPQAAESSQTPQALAARFEAAIATIVSNSVASNGSNGSSNGQGGLLDQQLSSQPAPAHDVTSTPVSSLPAPAPSFATLVNTIAQQAPSHASPVDANAVIEQMMKGMVMRTDDEGASTIRLHLQPENLGEMTMHITVSGSQISASVVTANADVRNALLSNHQQLARSLQDAGLTLSGFSVDVSGGNAGRDENRDRTTGFGRRYVVHELQGGTSQETPALSTLAPTLMNGASLELFNYLV